MHTPPSGPPHTSLMSLASQDSFTMPRKTRYHQTNVSDDQFVVVACSHSDFFVSGEGKGSTPEAARQAADAALARALQGNDLPREQLPLPAPRIRPSIEQSLQDAQRAAWANAAQIRGPKQLVVVEFKCRGPAARGESSFGMLLPHLPEGSVSAPVSSLLGPPLYLQDERGSCDELTGEVSFRNGGRVPPLRDEAAWRRVLEWSSAWKHSGGNEPASMAPLETEEIVFVRLKDGAIDYSLDQGLVVAAGASCHGVYGSAVAEWLKRHPRKLQTGAAEAALLLMGEKALVWMVALHEFLAPYTAWSAQPAESRPNSCMTNHCALREAISRRLRSCSNSTQAAEAARCMFTRGLHLTEAWSRAFGPEERPASVEHVSASGGLKTSVRELGYSEFFVSNDGFIYVKYDHPGGWLRYHKEISNVSGQRHLYEQEPIQPSATPSLSPCLEEPRHWNVRVKLTTPIPDMSRTCSYLSPALLRLQEAHPALEAALPAKAAAFLLYDKPAQSLQSLRHIGAAAWRYRFLHESAELEELCVGYLVAGRTTWRRYRPSRDGRCSGFEWSTDSLAAAVAQDRLSSFKRVLDVHIIVEGESSRWAWLTDRMPSDSISQQVFYRKLEELGAISESWKREIWFRLVGPDGSKLRERDLEGRWLEVRYSELFRTLVSGNPLLEVLEADQRLLPPKVVEFLKGRHLASLVVPKPNAPGVVLTGLTAKRVGARCILPLAYSEEAKTWIGFPPGCSENVMQGMLASYEAPEPEAEPDSTRPSQISGSCSGAFQQRAQQALLIESARRPVAEAFRSAYGARPSKTPPAQVRGPVPRAIDIPSIEAKLTYHFSNPMLLVEAFSHSSLFEGELPVVTPSQRCLAILGAALVRYLVVERVLARNELLTPDCADLQERQAGKAQGPSGALSGVEASAWLRPENLRDTLDVATCSASLARACVRLQLHHQLLHHSPGLAQVLSRIPLQREENSAGPSWEQFVGSDAGPSCLGETFCAALAAILLDATWEPAHKILSELVDRTVLIPILETKWFALTPGSFEDGAKDSANDQVDDVHLCGLVAGSCKLTARVRASLPCLVDDAIPVSRPCNFCPVCGEAGAGLGTQPGHLARAPRVGDRGLWVWADDARHPPVDGSVQQPPPIS